MTHLQKLRTPFPKWVSSNFVGSHKTPFSPIGSSLRTAVNPRCYGKKRIVEDEKLGETLIKMPTAWIKEAQAALLEYLHSTRSIQFMDAENMSKNSPYFLGKILDKVNTEAGIGQSMARFFRYHPINEFEPFFESLGLKPFEYNPLLPRDLLFLSDDGLLLKNYYVLCNYGIARNKIGKIYKEATEVFRYDYGVLELKLKAYEELGLSKSLIIKLVACSPYLLIGDVNVDIIKVLEILKKGMIECSWIEEHLSEKNCYNWSLLLMLLNLFCRAGYSEEQLGALINQHPGILLESSGDRTLSLIGFLLKFGSTINQICSMFLQFPQMQVGKFLSNLRHCFLFLNEIEMEKHEIGKIIYSHPLLLGSFTLKRTSSLLVHLNIGKKRLCKFIQENPQEMKKWKIGLKIEPMPNSGEELRSQILRTRFLLEMGFVENSGEMERTLKLFRGRGTELQERFDSIVNAGLDKKYVCKMIKASPQILNQKKEVIKMKIDYLVNDMGYPISSLIIFPSYLAYTTQRVKLRLTMYRWLQNQGAVDPNVALSSVIGSPEKKFLERYVTHHPKGPEIWEGLKKKIYSK